MDAIREREHDFITRAMRRWSANPSIEILGSPDAGRLSIVSFVVRHDGRYLHHNFVVALLNDLFGIQSRGGCSCAGPYGHRLLGIDIETSHEFEREITRGCEGIKPGWVRVNFNYFISEAVFEFLLDAVDLVATDGWRLLPDYSFEPASGLWHHRAGRPEPPASLCDVRYDDGRMDWPSHRHHEPESRLAGYLDEARAFLARPVVAPPTPSVIAGRGRPGLRGAALVLAPRGGGGRGRSRAWLTSRAAFRRSSASTWARPRRRRRRSGWTDGCIGLGRAGYPLDVGPDGRAEQDRLRDWWAAVSAAVRTIDVSGVDVVAVCGVAQGPTLAVVDAGWRARATGDHLAGPAADRGRIGRRVRAAADRLPGWHARSRMSSARRAWLLSAWDALGLWLSGEAATSLQGHETALDDEALRRRRVAERLRGGAAPVRVRARGLAPGGGRGAGPAGRHSRGRRRERRNREHARGRASARGRCRGHRRRVGRDRDATRTRPSPSMACSSPRRRCRDDGSWAGAMAALGASVDWLRESVLGRAASAEVLMAEAAAAPPGAGGLLFLPYLAGERAPLFDDAARGAFVGLTLAHGRAELARAVLEGAAFAMRSVAEPLSLAGAPIRELRLAGRRSPGDAWARIKADVLGVPVAIPTMGESAVLGAAIVAAGGVGAVRDLEAGVEAMTSIAARIEPDPAARARYDELYAVYRDLWPAIAPTVHAIDA